MIQKIRDLFKKEPVFFIGAAIAGLTALAGVIGDGWQWNPDGLIVGSAVLTALGIRVSPDVWSQDTVDELSSKMIQEKVKRDRKRRR